MYWYLLCFSWMSNIHLERIVKHRKLCIFSSQRAYMRSDNQHTKIWLLFTTLFVELLQAMTHVNTFSQVADFSERKFGNLTVVWCINTKSGKVSSFCCLFSFLACVLISSGERLLKQRKYSMVLFSTMVENCWQCGGGRGGRGEPRWRFLPKALGK